MIRNKNSMCKNVIEYKKQKELKEKINIIKSQIL